MTASRKPLLHPDNFRDEQGNFSPPQSLSASSMLEFQQCPQSFFFQYILGLKQPVNLHLAKGLTIHAALHQIMKQHTPQSRTLELLQELFDRRWKQVRSKYQHLFDTEQEEATWVEECYFLLQNYMQVEDPSTIDPAPRTELWLDTRLAVDSYAGATSPVPPPPMPATQPVVANPFSSHPMGTPFGSFSPGPARPPEKPSVPTFAVRGVMDRVDEVVDEATGESFWRICDYKTAKAPRLQYSVETNQDIQEDAFFSIGLVRALDP